MTNDTKRPVFIVGCARSGTTWLYHLLLSSGDFAIYRSETQLYNRFGPLFGNFRNLEQRRQFLDGWLTSEFFLRSGLDADSFREAVLNSVASTGDLLRTLMDRICDEQGARRWAECTPDHALFIRQILRDFPDALFIHMVRDGRDVALSLAKQSFIKPLPWHGDQPELASAAYWAWITSVISREEQYVGKRMLTVRYENLVLDYEKTLQEIATFIGKPIDASRIAEHSVGAVLEPNSSFLVSDREAATGSAQRWKQNPDRSLVRRIESIIGHGLERCGYEPAYAPESQFERLVSAFRRRQYFFRFQVPRLARRSGIAAHLESRSLESGSSLETSSDPTLRPRENIAAIRDIVRL